MNIHVQSRERLRPGSAGSVLKYPETAGVHRKPHRKGLIRDPAPRAAAKLAILQGCDAGKPERPGLGRVLGSFQMWIAGNSLTLLLGTPDTPNRATRTQVQEQSQYPNLELTHTKAKQQ